MQKTSIRGFAADSDSSITLLSGLTVPLIYVTFDPSTYHFYYLSKGVPKIDVTNDMTREQKQLFAGFDPAQDNIRMSNIGRTGQDRITAPLNTNTAGLFVDNVAKDIAQKTELGVSTIGIGIGVGIVAYLILKSK
jgi:hypothetical protein